MALHIFGDSAVRGKNKSENLVVGDAKLKVNEVMEDTGPNYELLRELVPEEVVEKIRRFGLRVCQGEDLCVWKHTVDGEFTTKSAWEVIRKHGLNCTWRRWLWQDFVPKKMSFICWRARRKAIPVDDIIRSIRIPIVSKCSYCLHPQVETLNHILCEGDGAKQVWKFFAEACQLQLPHIRKWEGMMSFWWEHSMRSSQVGWTHGVLPIIILWALWKARCLA
ncbi:uncharacterized protein LOC121267058 [Juglans microcarpa x Juglans regia]|uniref:uncharacterized protein LOC121267058 n=1 Tax=Juglans microcarpa x Juglans regia TaxID=2249226 RepID=UPI001B7ECF85|nr:uncharacterized protein LOC121267058 [Juglans microcarpa x Juglans regia]